MNQINPYLARIARFLSILSIPALINILFENGKSRVLEIVENLQ